MCFKIKVLSAYIRNRINSFEKLEKIIENEKDDFIDGG